MCILNVLSDLCHIVTSVQHFRTRRGVLWKMLPVTDGLKRFNEIDWKCFGHMVHFDSNYLPLMKRLWVQSIKIKTVPLVMFWDKQGKDYLKMREKVAVVILYTRLKLRDDLWKGVWMSCFECLHFQQKQEVFFMRSDLAMSDSVDWWHGYPQKMTAALPVVGQSLHSVL